MPDAEEGCDHLESIFVNHIYSNMGSTTDSWKMTAAISGAHTLGQARISNSGFNGHWSDAANQGKFNNDYYKSLLLKGWFPEKSVNGNSGKNQWLRIDEHTEVDGHHEIMLNSDMCLAYDNDGRAGTLKSADSDCCGWIESRKLFNDGVLVSGAFN